MSLIRRDRSPGGARHWLAATVAALGLLCFLVAPVGAVTGPTHLSSPTVSPRSATLGAEIAFSVVYRNHQGSAPDRVLVLIDGSQYAMTPTAPLDWKAGVTYTLTRALAVGEHTIVFAAADTRKFTDEMNAGSVTITRPAPAPTPKPSPKPTPAPAGAGSQSGGSSSGGGGSGSSGGSGAGGSSGSGAGSPTSGGTSTGPGGNGSTGKAGGDVGAGSAAEQPPTLAMSPGAAADAVAGDGPRPPLPATGPWSMNGTLAGERAGLGTGPSGTDAGAGPDILGAGDLGQNPGDRPGSGSSIASGGTAIGSGGGSGSRVRSIGDGLSPWTPLQAILGGPSNASLEARIFVSMAETGAVVGMTMAFGFFAKRRRDDEPPAPDEVLQAAAAVAPAVTADGAMVPSRPVAPPVDAEMLMPRWRRPSLLEARKADPTRMAVSTVNLTFDEASFVTDGSQERRTIRYRVVRLLDGPDELMATEIGFVDQGDEVQLLERQGAYWRVLCPDGRTGWVHKMVLGDVVDPAADQAGGVDGIDDDVLRAYLKSRRGGTAA